MDIVCDQSLVSRIAVGCSEFVECRRCVAFKLKDEAGRMKEIDSGLASKLKVILSHAL